MTAVVVCVGRLIAVWLPGAVVLWLFMAGENPLTAPDTRCARSHRVASAALSPLDWVPVSSTALGLLWAARWHRGAGRLRGRCCLTRARG